MLRSDSAEDLALKLETDIVVVGRFKTGNCWEWRVVSDCIAPSVVRDGRDVESVVEILIQTSGTRVWPFICAGPEDFSL